MLFLRKTNAKGGRGMINKQAFSKVTDTDILFARLKKPHCDSITKRELWETFSIEQIETHLGYLKLEIQIQADHLKQALNLERHNFLNLNKKYCIAHPDDFDCEAEVYHHHDNYDIVSMRLTKYKETQRHHQELYDYCQRRQIKEEMERRLGTTGYWILEWTVLFLIFAVLVLLYMEYQFFDPTNPASYAVPQMFFLLGEVTLIHIAWFDVFACSIFLYEYAFRAWVAKDRKWYFRNHKIDLISSIPLTAITILLPIGYAAPDLLVLRTLRMLRVFRALRIATFIWRGMERLEQVTSIHIMKKSFLILLFLMVAGTISLQFSETGAFSFDDRVETVESVMKAEDDNQQRNDDEKYIKTPAGSFWWSATTLTSAGFGDLYKPKTPAGWLLATLLVVAGIVVVGIFTAAMTSIFRGDDTAQIKHQLAQLQDQVRDLQNRPDSD